MHTLLCLCTRGEKKKGTADCKGEGGIEVERDGEINWKVAIFRAHTQEAIRPIVEFRIFCGFWKVGGWLHVQWSAFMQLFDVL